ncbi:hypothetical protein CIL05_20155 [Virgibacillus profundi]|uniref:Uncharacterized protein n=1 Tax=Virgibacillus profundi TaxID=2024555 RepID=A0A2A2I9Q9_9BACI|nr:hypothetical protein [Virgibacillus profundi]PAV27793.1 hypothetical protein CIL05_20155 [Virgibacillus profundi]PXY52015.1 hypothetical protein CIT14_20135 [Virgibacillus profundi]
MRRVYISTFILLLLAINTQNIFANNYDSFLVELTQEIEGLKTEGQGTLTEYESLGCDESLYAHSDCFFLSGRLHGIRDKLEELENEQKAEQKRVNEIERLERKELEETKRNKEAEQLKEQKNEKQMYKIIAVSAASILIVGTILIVLASFIFRRNKN